MKSQELEEGEIINSPDKQAEKEKEKDDPIAIDKKRMDIARADFQDRLKQYLASGNPMFRLDKKENE